MKPIMIYTDGSCLGNPGPGGWAAVIEDDGETIELTGATPNTTNNRMEMTAVIRALEWVQNEYGAQHRVEVHTDSSLIVNTMNKGWKRKSNGDLWGEMEAILEHIDVTFKWVKGHNNHPQNERCDELAVAEAERLQGGASQGKPSPQKSTSNEDDSVFTCGACGQTTAGKLGYLPDAELIRVDCLHCGKYLKFASPTPHNLNRAQQRPLMTKSEIKAYAEERAEAGEPLTERQIKSLKKMTRDEARALFEANQKLF